MAKVDLSAKLRTARARIDAESADAAGGVLPKFAQLTRKEARVREDQYAALSALARSLMRRRHAKGERITENTLIRIAIDLLLQHKDALRGASEEQLRSSVTSAIRESGSPEPPHPRVSEVPGRRSASGAIAASPSAEEDVGW
ncbi:MAG TPA: hypothetical protein VJR25_02710 [Microbacterium sp.]|uniref:hypothetical protein n=1 Tax=Microbacterium sp. TaxID=51671 RepID=UPI002B464C78|nr:hypothetical protein [Microbacterium sp.]HKT55660.1 hypothetical protein [Microbacterium sp.]